MNIFTISRLIPDSCPFSLSDIERYMKLTNTVKDLEATCYSRQIGVVIVDPVLQTVISTGHNGVHDKMPKCDNVSYLRDVVWLNLTEDEKSLTETGDRETFSKKYAGCAICPRKIINAPSGKRLELCTCIHAETEAIVKAGRSVVNCWIFASCSVPCIECTKLIIESKIAGVFCLDSSPDYSPHSSRWMFEHSNTDLYLVKEN